MRHRLQNISTVKKVLILSICFLALPTMIYSIYLYNSQAVQFYRQLHDERKFAAEQLSGNIQKTVDSASALSLDLAYRSPLLRLLSRDNLQKYPIWSSKSINDTLSSINYSLKYQNIGISTAYIYFIHSELEEDYCFRWAQRLETLPFFQQFENSENLVDIFYLKDTAAADYYKESQSKTIISRDGIVLLLRKVMNAQDECIGYILFEIPPHMLLSAVSSANKGTQDYLLWFKNTDSYYGTPPSDELLAHLKEKSVQFEQGEVHISGKTYLSEPINGFDIRIVEVAPLSKALFVDSALKMSLILLWLVFVQMLLLNLFIKLIFFRLNRDLNQMDQIVANEFNGRIPVKKEDEAGQIAKRYNILLDEIGTLVEDLVKKETAGTATQLKALQYQINPHFIYNTLGVFSGYADQSGYGELAESIASFGHLLRYNIRNDGLYATVQSELANAEALINVYAIRYVNRLHLEIRADPDVMELPLMKFIIQPILENSILHGLADPHDEMLIEIMVKQEGTDLTLSIADNGTGMSDVRLQEVRAYALEGRPMEVPNTNGFFIGLSNINERIRLFYGNKARMELDSIEGEGTQVVLCIPIQFGSQ